MEPDDPISAIPPDTEFHSASGGFIGGLMVACKNFEFMVSTRQSPA
jgi:hypothetical protein